MSRISRHRLALVVAFVVLLTALAAAAMPLVVLADAGSPLGS
jgi:hypothetical protein